MLSQGIGFVIQALEGKTVTLACSLLAQMVSPFRYTLLGLLWGEDDERWKEAVDITWHVLAYNHSACNASMCVHSKDM